LDLLKSKQIEISPIYSTRWGWWDAWYGIFRWYKRDSISYAIS
jgi:hypothetical protein